jgi:phosphoglycolate phosphatase
MSGPPLAIYDLDGTLADTATDIAASLIRVISREVGLQPSPAQVIAAVGWGAPHLVRTVLGPEHQARSGEVLTAFRDDYRANLVVDSRPYPGIPALLGELHHRGWTQAVLTNKPGELSRALLRQLELDHWFAVAWGPEDVPRKKPSPQALQAVLEKFDVEPGDAVMIGDMETDIDCARAAGVRSILVTWSEFPRPAELAQRADAVAASVEELRSLLIP